MLIYFKQIVINKSSTPSNIILWWAKTSIFSCIPVFAHHKIMLDGLEDLLITRKQGFVRIDGTVIPEERKQLVDIFQTDCNCKVAVLGITACSSGLTLHKASWVIFAELYYTPAIMIQAEDRAHRIGQKNHVNVVYLYGVATIDEIFYPRIREKYFVVSTILDDKVINLNITNYRELIWDCRLQMKFINAIKY